MLAFVLFHVLRKLLLELNWDGVSIGAAATSWAVSFGAAAVAATPAVSFGAFAASRAAQQQCWFLPQTATVTQAWWKTYGHHS